MSSVFGRGSRMAPGVRVRACWAGAVLADSDATVDLDGKPYFPPESVDWSRLRPSDKETVCLWKGRATYYTIDVDGRRKRAAAWSYETPHPAAAAIAGHLAFGRGVRVERAGP